MSKADYRQRICVVGLGYIGLPTAAMFAHAGFDVRGIDQDLSAVEMINSGFPHIDEPGLELMVSQQVREKRLIASTVYEPADIFILAVPTPLTDTKAADLQYVFSALSDLATVLRGGELLIVESTVPPKSTALIAAKLVEMRPDLLKDNGSIDVDIAHCPERVLPGKILEELASNDRIVGGLTLQASMRAKKLYENVTRGEVTVTDATTAELAKLTENAYRDVNIAFANELSLISDSLGVDVHELISVANKHPRVNILKPGTGVGGHCIAVDPWFIVDAVPAQTNLIKTARLVNDFKTDYVLSAIRKKIEAFEPRTVYIYGLAFKPDVGDLREAPAVKISKSLLSEFEEIQFVMIEPNIRDLPVSLQSSPNAIFGDFDKLKVEKESLHVVLVSHKEFIASPHLYLQDNILDFVGLV